jgi:hypothetical protein
MSTRRAGIMRRFLWAGFGLVFAGASTLLAQTSADFTQSVAPLGPADAQVRFVPNGFTAGYVIVHYLVNNVNQQNQSMSWNAGAGRWEQTVSGLTTGALVTYSFTYQKNGTQYDSQWFLYTHGDGPTATPLPPRATPTPTATPLTPVPTPTPTATPMTPPPTVSPTPPGGCYTEVTPGASSVTASGNDGNVPGNTVDNSWSTRWSASGDGQWIRYDLGSLQTVGHVKVAFYSGNTRQARFDLQTSTDGTSWASALTNVTSSGTTTAEQTFDFADRSARYVRYLGHGNTVNAWNSLYEVSVFATCTGGTPTATPPVRVTPTPTPTMNPVTPTPTPGAGCPTCTTKRLKIVNGCTQPMWIQYHTGAGGGTLNAPNRQLLPSQGSFIEYDIPDKGLAGVRFWPGMGCDSSGQNCTIGASGGPATMGFTCPAGIGCAPPVDTKFEGSFGCLPGVTSSACQPNPSGSGVLGRNDWWNTSMVDGYTLPVRVRVSGSCPVGPQPDSPGGPMGGVVDCSSLRFSDCPRGENLSTDGKFPGLSNLDLLLKHPNPDGSLSTQTAGCFSPSAKLTSGQWQSIPHPPFNGTTYAPTDPQAEWYACPSPPITPAQCVAGPASRTTYTSMIHSRCNNTYAYAYDDVAGLLACPAATNLKYEVTFFCPQ